MRRAKDGGLIQLSQPSQVYPWKLFLFFFEDTNEAWQWGERLETASGSTIHVTPLPGPGLSSVPLRLNRTMTDLTLQGKKPEL